MNPASTQQSPESSQPFNSAGASPAKERGFDISRSLRMHRTVAVVVAIAVFVGILSFGLSRRPYYETSALIYVQPMKTKVITDNTDAYDPGRYETFLQQQLQTITRADIIGEALSKPATRAWRFPHEPEQAAIARLQHSIKVERVEQSYELSISLSGGDPVAIADVVNAVSNAYIRGERADEMSQSDQQLQILQDELQRVSIDLNNDRREQAQLSISLGVADTSGDTGNPFDVQLVELRSELAKATAAHDVAAAEYASVDSSRSGSAQNLSSAADDLTTTDPSIAALKQTIGQRRSVLTSQMAGLTPRNPLYALDQQELDRLDLALATMEGQVRVKTSSQLQHKLQLEERRTADIVARISQELAAKTSIATGATPELQHAADLAADITRLQGRYNAVDNAINTIELDKDTSGLVHILVPAVAPLAPKTSMKRMILISALPLALLLGLAAALLMSKLDPRIYIGKDLARLLGFFPMATLPNKDEVDRPVRDEFILRLLAGIDQIHRMDGAKTFVFTGASADVSVTELVGSLSRKMQRLGYRAATIRASELIENHELSSGLFSTTQDELASPVPVVTHENFVAQKIETLNQDADFVFIDAYPLLSSSETEFAARLCDVVILVSDSAATTRSELRSSFALVTRLHVPGAATVVNHVSLHNADDEFIASVHNVQRRNRPA